MQLICPILIDAERFVSEERHRQMRPPHDCPHCGRHGALWALGYYARHLSILSRRDTLRLKVRRFRCRWCRKTVSLLPWFAQPYRLIQNETIHRFATRQRGHLDVLHWTPLLVRYWRRFERWIPELSKVTGHFIGRGPPRSQPEAWWLRIVDCWGGPEEATAFLIGSFRITLFGRYRCHHPNPLPGNR